MLRSVYYVVVVRWEGSFTGVIFGATEDARYEMEMRTLKKEQAPTISCHLSGTKRHAHGSLHAVVHRHRLRFKGATLVVSRAAYYSRRTKGT